MRAELERAAPAVVLLDIGLPGEDGLTLARELIAGRPGLPVILYTGHGGRITQRDVEGGRHPRPAAQAGRT